MDDSDMDISLDSIVYDTVDNFKYDVAVEANFIDPAYESESGNSMEAIYSGYTDSSGIYGCADPHAKFGPDPCNNFREVPLTLHESVGHNIYQSLLMKLKLACFLTLFLRLLLLAIN